MKYFARGKLWASQEDARSAAEARRATERRPDSRGWDWRPGGEHRDPRQKFKDAKKERNLEWRKQRFERRQQSGTTNRPAEHPARPGWRDRAPRAGKPQGQWRNRPRQEEKPPGDSPRRQTSRPLARNRFERRNQSTEEPPPRLKGPDRQPKPGEVPKPAPPPRATEPAIRPPGPRDRGRRGGGPPRDRRRRS